MSNIDLIKKEINDELTNSIYLLKDAGHNSFAQGSYAGEMDAYRRALEIIDEVCESEDE